MSERYEERSEGREPQVQQDLPARQQREAADDENAYFGQVVESAVNVRLPPPSPKEIERRAFLTRVTFGLGGALAALMAIPPLGFLLAPLVEHVTEQWRDLGSVEDFPVGQVRLTSFEEPSPLPWAGQTARTAAWVRRTSEQEFTVFAVNCTHLGCPVNWLEAAQLFLCPCHGGAYYADGNVAAGPPPRPLWRYEHRVENGVLQVLTSPLPATRARDINPTNQG